MAFLDSIAKPRVLKATSTRVRQADGTVWTETRDADGQVHASLVGGDPGEFFVVDATPDPVLACVLEEQLYIGSQDAACNEPGLAEARISHVLNLASGVPNFFPDALSYCKLIVLDTEEFDIASFFERTNAFIADAIAAGGRVLVHCNAGVSRSATAVLAFLLAHRQLRLDDALVLLQSRRSKVKPNPGFLRQLRDYERQLTAAAVVPLA